MQDLYYGNLVRLMIKPAAKSSRASDEAFYAAYRDPFYVRLMDWYRARSTANHVRTEKRPEAVARASLSACAAGCDVTRSGRVAGLLAEAS